MNITGEEIGTVDSNIVKRFGEYLKKSGYSVSGTVYPFISECIKEENGETAVIQLVDLSDTYGAGSEGISRESAGMEWIDPEMLKEQTENVTDVCGGDNVHVLTLFFADDYRTVIPLMRDDPMCWVIEPDKPRLVIDELRIKDFHGMRDSIVNFLIYMSESNREPVIKKEKPSPVVYGLVAVNIVIFILSAYVFPETVNAGMMDYDLVKDGQLYRLITAMFLHGGVDHILGNMLSLFVMGTLVEREAGSVKFTVIYMLSGIMGNLTSFLYEMISGVRYTSVGASGAIYGIMGAVVLLALKRRSGLNVTGRRLFIAVAYCIYSSFAMPGIDYAAHIGGLVSGFLMSTLLLR